MDEQLVLEIYNRNKFSERGISLDKFKRDIVNDEILRNEIYTRSKFKDRGISLSKFETDLGITSVSNEPKESKGIFDYVTQAARSQKSTSGIGEKIKSESYDTTTTYGKLHASPAASPIFFVKGIVASSVSFSFSCCNFP